MILRQAERVACVIRRRAVVIGLVAVVAVVDLGDRRLVHRRRQVWTDRAVRLAADHERIGQQHGLRVIGVGRRQCDVGRRLGGCGRMMRAAGAKHLRQDRQVVVLGHAAGAPRSWRFNG